MNNGSPRPDVMFGITIFFACFVLFVIWLASGAK